MPSADKPGSVPLATLATRIESMLSRDISGSPGSHSISSAWARASTSGRPKTRRGWPDQRPAAWTIWRSV